MKRRKFLSTLAIPAVSALPSLKPAFAGGLSPKLPYRRVRPTDAAWPDAKSWEKLNEAVSGNLIKVQALFQGCQAEPKGLACLATQKNAGNPYWLGDQPGGTENSGWLDAWAPAPSVYAIKARDAGDVAAGINFARDNKLRLVVKGGGHSYQGTSNAPDSLLIWTRAMNGVTLHEEFVAQGCARQEQPRPAVTVEAGAMWIDAYDAVTTQVGRYVQGGGCTTVGVAGLVQSGGFGSFSKNYGTAASSLLQAEIVTADAELRIVNRCIDPELF